MLTEIFQKSTLFSRLVKIDHTLSEDARKKGCPHCGGPLHYANYERKPRGGSNGIPEECLVRFSLCCSRNDCRRRTLPPSCRFNGRRVYWHGVMLAAMTLKGGLSPGRAAERFSKNFGVTRNTIARWAAWYRDVFPATPLWQRIRGQVDASIGNHNLPGDLVAHVILRYRLDFTSGNRVKSRGVNDACRPHAGLLQWRSFFKLRHYCANNTMKLRQPCRLQMIF